MSRYLQIDEKLKVGGYAIADNIVDIPVKILRLGQIFASVEDCVTGYKWDLMVNRLQATEPSQAVLEQIELR